MALADVSALGGDSHVCWLVRDEDDYVAEASRFLEAASDAGDKPVVFGPEDSAALAALEPLAALALDPRRAFLDGGPLDAAAMFAGFEEQSCLALEEGYRGLRLVADMDWLLPDRPTTDELVAFELLLDREARRLRATIVCAYRESSFDADAVSGARCVHPIGVGDDVPPQFVLVADDWGWRLRGEVDIAVTGAFGPAIRAALSDGACVIDTSELRFIDLPAMRQIAEAVDGRPLRVVGAPRGFRRCWEAAGFQAVAPTVELAN